MIYGPNAVLEALRAGKRQIEAITILESARPDRLKSLLDLAREKGVPVHRVPRFDLDRTLGNIEEVTNRLKAGEGSLGKLLADDSLARSLTSATGNIEQLTAKLNRGEGTAGKLLNDTAVYDRLDSITRRVDQLLVRLNEGEGTAGQLLKDKQLYENMNKAVNDLSGVLGEFKTFLAEVRKDPKKYLNVRVSIF